jgi:hypothetical protein
MSTKQHNMALAATLELAGLGNIRIEPAGWLAFADPDVAQNERVHRATNDLLFSLLGQGDTGRCIHVTGEMRALLDPFHRELCSQMHRQCGRVFSVLYNLPEDRRLDRNLVIAWSLERWAKKGRRSWQDYLRTFDVIGERAVDVRAGMTENLIQYSVFGSRYVQLQEKHQDAQPAKRVWLLESPELNEALTECGEQLLREAVDIDERWYRAFVSSLNNLGARSILLRLADGKTLAKEELDDGKLRDFDASATPDAANALRTMGFVTEHQNGLKISPHGKEYFGMLMRS